MQSREIQPQEWQKFFDDFSRKYEGRSVGIEILGADIGAQMEENGMMLKGLTLESGKGSESTITIMVGTRADDHVTHSINRPVQVSLGTEGDADFALAIKGEDGATTLLRLQSARLSESSDAGCP